MKALLLIPVLATLSFVAPPRSEAADAGVAAPAVSPWIALARGRVEPSGGIVQVASARDGVVKSVLVAEGDHVALGQALASLHDESAQLNLALAQKELAQTQAALTPLQLRANAAQREVQRLAPLAAEQLANAADLDNARSREALAAAEIDQAKQAVATAQARLDIAQHEVDVRVIRAPVAGRILRRLVASGEGVSTQAATPLFWLAPDGPLTVRAQLDENSARLVSTGQSAEIVPDFSNHSIATATVQSVGLVFGPRRPGTDDPAERQDVRVVDCVLVIKAPDSGLLIGQRVVVRFLRSAKPSP